MSWTLTGPSGPLSMAHVLRVGRQHAWRRHVLQLQAGNYTLTFRILRPIPALRIPPARCVHRDAVAVDTPVTGTIATTETIPTSIVHRDGAGTVDFQAPPAPTRHNLAVDGSVWQPGVRPVGWDSGPLTLAGVYTLLVEGSVSETAMHVAVNHRIRARRQRENHADSTSGSAVYNDREDVRGIGGS